MNGLSFRDLCYLFCCPPFPNRIASKLAFLPPEVSYDIQPIPAPPPNPDPSKAAEKPDISKEEGAKTPEIPEVDPTEAPPPIDVKHQKNQLILHEKADWQYSEKEREMFEAFYARSSRGNRVACLYVKCAVSPVKFTLLFSHGNAVDLGQMTSFFVGLGQRINCNIFSYDYSGYGQSTGKPSEKNLYADIDAAWVAMRARYGIRPEDIILYGQSIGTVPTVDLASR